MTATAAHQTSENFPQDIIEQAANWHAVMHSGEANAEEKAEFKAWQAVPENAAAYQRMVSMWGTVDGSADEENHTPRRNTLERNALESTLEDQRSAKRKIKRRSTGTILSIGLLASLLLSLQTMQSDDRLSAYLLSGRVFSDYSTSVGEHQVITLSDQTRVHLNTFSAINIEYTNEQRTIHLLQGEIYLDVAKDALRPLVVKSDQGSARALGTQFTVRDRGDVTEVTVTESRVEVCAEASSLPCQQLHAGERTVISHGQVSPTQTVNNGFTRDWSQQFLIVDNQPVLDVLDELSRYQSGYLRLDRKALANYTISGVFPLNNMEKSLKVLEGSLPIKVSRYTALLTVVGVE